VPDIQLIKDFFAQQPFLAYALLATLILAVVSFFSGLSRLDVLGALSPQGLFTLTLAAATAWLIQSQGSLIPIELFQSQAFLAGLSRFPLYLAALAYGPSAGILTGGLFLAFGPTGAETTMWLHVILLLELAVAGWFAISPSPRQNRFAGPLAAFLAYSLSWATAGSALLQWQSGTGSSLAAHMALHQDVLLGVAFSWLALVFVSPNLYRILFPYSRIVLSPRQTQKATLQTPVSAKPTPALSFGNDLLGLSPTRSNPSAANSSAANPALSNLTAANPSKHPVASQRPSKQLDSHPDLPTLTNRRSRQTQILPQITSLSNPKRRQAKRQLSPIALEDIRES
jgi:hypothetical protein